MTLALLLTLFELFTDRDLAGLSPAVQERIQTLPAKPEAFNGLVDEAMASALGEPDEADQLERLVSILEAILKVNGATEQALLRIVEAASSSQSHADAVLGIRPLGALARYYARGGPSSCPPHELLSKLERFAEVDVLFINALACRRALLKESTPAALDQQDTRQGGGNDDSIVQGDLRIQIRDGLVTRQEYKLQSGRDLVDDAAAGLSVVVEIRTEFDWQAAIPGGAHLTEARMARWRGPAFVVRYQQWHNEAGTVVQKRLKLVEEYLEGARIRVKEFDRVVPVPSQQEDSVSP